jgi:hypothetical protein
MQKSSENKQNASIQQAAKNTARKLELATPPNNWMHQANRWSCSARLAIGLCSASFSPLYAPVMAIAVYWNAVATRPS